MDLKFVQRLINMMDKGGVRELELEDPKNGLKVRLKRGADESAAPAQPQIAWMQAPAAMHGYAPPPAMHGAPAPAGAALPGGAPSAGGAPAAPAVPQGTPIPSPMVGTFYRSASPEAEPFVTVGSKISVDQTLCIIEAMKVMNEIRAEVAGEIVQILVENGEPVEFGQPLFLVKPL